jgi:hypothetical protein
MSFPFRRRGRGVRRAPGVMNGLEKQYALHLDLLKSDSFPHEERIEWWKFEAIKLKLADATFYNPDFIVMKYDGEIEIHEVKGSKKSNGKTIAYVEDDSRCKLKVAAQLFPFRFFQIHKGSDGQWVKDEI